MADIISRLNEIDILEIGPVKIGRDKLSMPYRIFKDDNIEEIDLIYKYMENVFDDTIESENMASVIGSQVAFNYGLFCKKIVFRGSFSETDQKFIREMIDISSNEILVSKILKDNIYLKDELKKDLYYDKDIYRRADIEFLNDGIDCDMVDKHTSLMNSGERYAVLSSGGKDSLLSYALLNELGFDVHPVFVNESGRHWFTSLNAYRYFQNNIKNTSRVWTNSDRVFNFFLRHFSFIKKDYQKLPSDNYPLRLWTVAVFIFGVLPLLRKRGIERIIIGDEYDTTYRLTHKGIVYYNAVYDQSRYFDNALTRYYKNKGYNFLQFSILRNLSEFMIQKILHKRYPDLQKLQISCHSALVKDDTARPCGKCEKCRRIISMLTALGADPRECGYEDSHIERAIMEFIKKGAHQEQACTAHVKYLLYEAGYADASKIQPREEVLSLRFDREKSPFSTMPVDIRLPLFKVFSEYCKRSCKKEGRVWVEFDLFNDPLLNKPYPFDSLKMRSKSVKKIKYLPFEWGKLKWPEAKEYLNVIDIALLPVGSIEQHGPHLPLDTDAFDAQYIAIEVAKKCKDPKPLVLPLVPYGVSYHHDDFPGTISIGPETLFNIIYDIGISLARNGITKLVIINGHGGNSPAVNMAAQKINRDAHIFTCVDSGDTSDADVSKLIETPNDVHAGEIETSTSLANRKELVDMKKIKRFIPDFSNRYLNYTSKRSVSWYARTAKVSKSGVLGDPTKASYEKGIAIWGMMISNLVKFIDDLKDLSLDEIYQKKY